VISQKGHEAAEIFGERTKSLCPFVGVSVIVRWSAFLISNQARLPAPDGANCLFGHLPVDWLAFHPVLLFISELVARNGFPSAGHRSVFAHQRLDERPLLV
jgi:hypothetical protein